MISNHGRATASISCPSLVFSPDTTAVCRSRFAAENTVTAAVGRSVTITNSSTRIVMSRDVEPQFGQGLGFSEAPPGASSKMVPQLLHLTVVSMPHLRERNESQYDLIMAGKPSIATDFCCTFAARHQYPVYQWLQVIHRRSSAVFLRVRVCHK